MIIDNNLVFSDAQAVTTSVASTSAIDLSGGVNSVWGNSTYFGEDIGVGDGINIPNIYITIAEAFVTGTSVQFLLQGKPDGGAYATYIETPAVLTADLTLGAQWRMPLSRRIFGKTLPRYLQLYYTVVGTYTLGKINAGVNLTQGIWDGGVYPANFTVAP